MTPSTKSSRNIEELINPHLLRLKPYTPIMPPEVLSQGWGLPLEGLIKLDGNENPYGCSPRVQRALAAYPSYHIYPDPEQRELRESLARYVGTGADHIVVSSGSDELIDLILRLFIGPGDKVIDCVPTFGMYPFYTGVCGGEVVEVPRDRRFDVDVSAVKAAIDHRTRVLFVASPNNPTGNVLSERDCLELLETEIVVVVDEAYYEFSRKTMAPLVSRYDNLIVLRTFSKWAGLAGLRVGYGVMSPRIVQHIMKIKPPYNVNVAGQVAALESLRDIEYLQGTVRAIVRERERLLAKLGELEFLQAYPSEANFILCSLRRGRAEKVYEQLQRKGIFLRYYDTPLLRNCLRISVGKPEHTDVLVAALQEIASSPAMADSSQ